MQPSYTIELISQGGLSNMVDQTSGSLAFAIGNNATFEKIGQTFTATSTATLRRVKFSLLRTGNPTDQLVLKLLASNKVTVLATSASKVTGSQLDLSVPLVFEFALNFELINTTVYFLELSRTGSVDVSNFFLAQGSTSNPYSGGSKWTFNGTVWSEAASTDLIFTVRVGGADVVDDISIDVHSISSINTGLNGVYGGIKQGQALILLNNNNSKYSPLNISSSLFNKFRINNKIKIKGIFNSITYNLFTGIIVNIEPLLNFNERKVSVRMLDVFSIFADKNVSIFNQPAKTASQLIQTLLQAAGLSSSDYNIETDTEVLQDVNFVDVNLITTLNEIVTAGQHFHFIDGDGVYQFKTNQFLSSNTPEFTYNDGDNDPGTAKQFYDITNIKNVIEVEYTGSLFQPRSDTESQDAFGDRIQILNNNLLKTGEYAGFIADYLLALQKDAGNIIELDLSSLFPDVFKVDFGTVIEVIDSFHSIDNVYNVLERTFVAAPSGLVSLRVKARKFVFPPDFGIIELEPFQDDALISLDANTEGFLQGFKVANDAELRAITHKVKLTVNNNFRVAGLLYELDGSGFPSVLVATSNFSNDMLIGSFDSDLTVTFPVGERPTLVTTKVYGVHFDFGPAQGAGGFSSLQVRGKTTDVYADGKPAEEVASSWATKHPNDFYFKAFLFEV